MGALVCLSGCGYTFIGPGARALPPAFDPVAVPMFENRTAESQLSVVCTRALQDRLSAGGRSVVSEPRGAALVIEGVIEAVEERPVAFDDLGQGVRRVEGELTLRVVMVARVDGQEVWRQERAEGSRLFAASGSPAQVDAARRQALAAACEEVAAFGGDALVDTLWAEPDVAQPAARAAGRDLFAAPEEEEDQSAVGAPPRRQRDDLRAPDQPRSPR